MYLVPAGLALTMFLFSFLHGLFSCLAEQKYSRKSLFHFDSMTVYIAFNVGQQLYIVIHMGNDFAFSVSL